MRLSILMDASAAAAVSRHARRLGVSKAQLMRAAIRMLGRVLSEDVAAAAPRRGISCSECGGVDHNVRRCPELVVDQRGEHGRVDRGLCSKCNRKASKQSRWYCEHHRQQRLARHRKRYQRRRLFKLATGRNPSPQPPGG